jgi:ornithine cyclodeaminase/alanine dehydrogenase-like protein (mu-crystallin family)
VIGLELPEVEGEVHVKGAYLHRAPTYSFKIASGFYRNPERGLPVGAGLVLAFSAETGQLAAVLFDNGYLTELRTGAAGALAADLLARRRVRKAAMVGVGGQARYQLEALAGVRTPGVVAAWGRDRVKAEAYAAEMRGRLGLDVEAVPSLAEAVEGADVVVTTTPAREPLLRAEWLSPGAHVTAVGSDMPGKQELDAALLARADKVVADRLAACLENGEIGRAVAAGAIAAGDVHAELGQIAAGERPGRESDGEITVADLTGVGVQDAAVAAFVVAEAEARGAGRPLEP